MKFSTLASAAVAFALQVQVALAGPTFTNCASSQADQNITDFSISPDPLCIGKNYTLTATGSLPTAVIAPAKLMVQETFRGRVVYTDNHDFCRLLADAGTPCPIATTTSTLSVVQYLLQKLGYETQSACDGQVAVGIIKAQMKMVGQGMVDMDLNADSPGGQDENNGNKSHIFDQSDT
ncbi:hypothetical protein BG006_005426 [Podila minutissima]|uniref:MD-2-related lipid-recognition domain-containing protein n=1 Tax=Podila minutissima TaxID=64525 RepID=A0A9P5SMJ6_9FUNG|nr:hypothetical protein BG006_005426 [Podila minutissima]